MPLYFLIFFDFVFSTNLYQFVHFLFYFSLKIISIYFSLNIISIYFSKDYKYLTGNKLISFD